MFRALQPAPQRFHDAPSIALKQSLRIQPKPRKNPAAQDTVFVCRDQLVFPILQKPPIQCVVGRPPINIFPNARPPIRVALLVRVNRPTARGNLNDQFRRAMQTPIRTHMGIATALRKQTEQRVRLRNTFHPKSRRGIARCERPGSRSAVHPKPALNRIVRYAMQMKSNKWHHKINHSINKLRLVIFRSSSVAAQKFVRIHLIAIFQRWRDGIGHRAFNVQSPALRANRMSDRSVIGNRRVHSFYKIPVSVFVVETLRGTEKRLIIPSLLCPP